MNRVNYLICALVWGMGCAENQESQNLTPADMGVLAIDSAPESPDQGMAYQGNNVAHQFPGFALAPFEETQPCVTWKLNNERALYVNQVTLNNEGAFHHSNWFVVPDEMYVGADGFFNCDDREFDELSSAVAGTVLFAQSTQSRTEAQDLPDGVVIKVPPHSRVVAGIHLLNLGARSMMTTARLNLELVHPRDVNVVVAPFRLGYGDLHIPPGLSRHTGECPMADNYQSLAGRPIDMKLYYVLPHYHALGNYFHLEVMGGPRDGEVILHMEGFNAEANGKTFDPPIDLTGITGLRLTCGYNNLTDTEVGWGIGDQEMCEFLGLADTEVMMDGWVREHNPNGVMNDNVVTYVSPCSVQAVPKNERQTMPTEEEMNGPLYRPESSPEDTGLDAVSPCVDAPVDAVAEGPTTLESIRDTIFKTGCNYSACHGGATAAAGLDLTQPDLASVLNGVPSVARPEMPLVDPGRPENSYLYLLLSKCEPVAANGESAAHMPRNAPTLLEPALVAKVREWIKSGAASTSE
jgi:hypothetical protein